MMLLFLAQIPFDLGALIRDLGVPGALFVGFGYALIRISNAQADTQELAAKTAAAAAKAEDDTRAKMDKITQDALEERRTTETRYLNERNMADQRYDTLRQEFHATREELVRTNTNLENANRTAENFRRQLETTEKLWVRETDTLKNDIKWLKEQIGELNGQLADKEKERRELAEMLATAQLREQDIAVSLQQKEAEHETERNVWKEQLDQRDKQIADLRAEVDQLTRRISVLEHDKTQVEGVPING